MAVSKKNFIEIELDFAEEQLDSWKNYIVSHPIEHLTDRIDYKETKSGGMMRTVVASIEAQGKYLQDLLKNYLALLKEVDVMRTQEAAKKIASRGDKEVTLFEEGMI